MCDFGEEACSFCELVDYLPDLAEGGEFGRLAFAVLCDRDKVLYYPFWGNPFTGEGVDDYRGVNKFLQGSDRLPGESCRVQRIKYVHNYIVPVIVVLSILNGGFPVFLNKCGGPACRRAHARPLFAGNGYLPPPGSTPRGLRYPIGCWPFPSRTACGV